MNKRKHVPEPELPFPFVIGSRVLLACCPLSAPGVVQGTRRKKIAVYWSDLRLTTYHQPSELILADDAEPPAAEPPMTVDAAAGAPAGETIRTK
jgi:hypothetical protein